jgi:adenylosuccinate synthase
MIVRRAIQANQPNRIVLNHLDYIDPSIADGNITEKAMLFLRRVEQQIGCEVNWVGTGPAGIKELRRQNA